MDAWMGSHCAHKNIGHETLDLIWTLNTLSAFSTSPVIVIIVIVVVVVAVAVVVFVFVILLSLSLLLLLYFMRSTNYFRVSYFACFFSLCVCVFKASALIVLLEPSAPSSLSISLFLFIWSHGSHYLRFVFVCPLPAKPFSICCCHCYFSPILHLPPRLFPFALLFCIHVFGIMCLIPGL